MDANELTSLIEVIQSLKLPEMASQVVYVGIILMLLKRYFFNGFIVFIKDAITRWLEQEQERIASQCETTHSLGHVIKTIDDMVRLMSADRTHYDQSIAEMKSSINGIHGKIEGLMLFIPKREDDSHVYAGHPAGDR